MLNIENLSAHYFRKGNVIPSGAGIILTKVLYALSLVKVVRIVVLYVYCRIEYNNIMVKRMFRGFSNLFNVGMVGNDDCSLMHVSLALKILVYSIISKTKS